MSSFNRAAFATLAFAILAACAGRGGSIPSTTDGEQGRLSPQVMVVSPSPGPSATPSPVPSPSAAPPNGTLYVATTATVYAFPLSSSGAVTASRSITPHPNGSRVTRAIATNADGTLDVLQNYFGGDSLQHCAVDVEPADANGSPFSTNVQCADPNAGQTDGDGIARNSIGGFDVFYNTPNAFNIDRYSSDGGSLSSSLPLAFTNAAITLSTDKGGHDYLANNQGEIRRYKPTSTTVTDTVADCTISAVNGDGPLVVAPDKTIYIVVRTQGTSANEQIDAITGCGTSGPATVSRIIGPYPNQYVSALAVDSQSELYVGLNSLAQSNVPPSIIRVYGPTASGKAVPVRVINPSPATTFIRGLATYEAAP